MKDKIFSVITITFIVILLAGCSKEEVPKCSDDKTTTLLKNAVNKIIKENIGGIEGLSEKEIQENMKIELPRASSFDEKIKKYTCEAKLITGGTYQLPINYESQLDDKGQHLVAVSGIHIGDLWAVKSSIIEGAKQSRPQPAEQKIPTLSPAVEPKPVTEPAPSSTTVPVDQQSK